MKIDTRHWLTLAEVCVLLGVSQSTGYRLAKDLGVVRVFFGTKCVHQDDLAKMRDGRRRVGNQRWIASPDAAAADALKSVRSRKRRIKRDGPTTSEVSRDKQLAVIGATKGGRKPRAAKHEEGSK